MCLSKISQSNLEKEMKSLTAIFNSISNRESIVFNSGAGAGKTYSLIQSLKYVIRNFEKKLKKHNQKIICITYTNVATTEVKERLGNTDLVLVSTIHERIWELIKSYQKPLVEIHKKKLLYEISCLNEKLKCGKGFEKYQELEDEQKERFKEIMMDSKELYYENYNVKVAELRFVFKTVLKDYPEILNNISNFKKIVNAIYNVEKYNKTYEYILEKKKNYKSVIYNSINNSDQIYNMKISHNTMLEYAVELIEQYDVLKQIIIDKYPYIFIDEYQDTDEKIVSIE